MTIINLKDYKGNKVAKIGGNGNIYILDVKDDILEIKKELSNDEIIFGVKEEQVFESDFIEEIKEKFIDYAFQNGYEDMEENLDFTTQEFEEVKKAVNKYIDSLGGANEMYIVDDDIQIITD